MRRILIVLLTACLVSLSAAPPQAAPQAAPASEENGLRMSLADCLRRALENNLDLVRARKDPLIAEQGVEAQKSPFDPILEAGGSYLDTTGNQTTSERELGANPQTGSGPTTNKLENAGATWSQLLKFGATYSAAFAMARTPMETSPPWRGQTDTT